VGRSAGDSAVKGEREVRWSRQAGRPVAGAGPWTAGVFKTGDEAELTLAVAGL
jgi:hypothetical protein